MTNSKIAIYFTQFNHKNWNFYMAATLKGLCYVGSQNNSLEKLIEWVRKRFPNHVLNQDHVMLQPYMKQFADYFERTRTEFTLRYDLQGTPFQLAVWNELQNIPYGETRPYSIIAKDINKPSAVRAVGTAIGANPILVAVPCHRVIGKNGSLTGYRGGLDMKTRLLHLEQEDVFDAYATVDKPHII